MLRGLFLSLLLTGLASAQPAVPKDPTAPESLGEFPKEPAVSAPQPEQKKLHVERFNIVGNTLLPDAEVNALVQRYAGQDLTLEQMKEVARNLTALYQKNGFMLTRAYIPAQQFKADGVEIQVINGRVGEVKVEGADYYPEEYIRRRFQSAFDGETFTSDRFQRSMLLMNELPDLQVKAMMNPGKEPGTADVTLKVVDRLPLHAGIDYNNYGTEATGVNRIGLSGEAGNLLMPADQLSVRGVIGFPSDQNIYYQVQYQAPVDLDGTTVSASYASGAFNVSQGLGAILDVRGNADIYTIGASRALDRRLDFSSNLGLAISYKDVNNSFFGGSVPFSRDVYTSGRLTYQADWRQPSGRSLLQAALTQGLGGTGSTDPLVSRQGASSSFTRFNLDLVRVQKIDRGLYGVVRASGQWSTQPLFLAEQMAVGGPDSVRGYSQAELLGDDAYVLSAELRWSPLENLDTLQFAAFIDHGGVHLKNRFPGELPNGSTLTGAGFGVRSALNENINVRLDLGFPITPSSRTGNSPALYIGVQTRL